MIHCRTWTVTVKATRAGLGRLARVYPAVWRIVALFHAEEDLHRVRAEVPCTMYRLPRVNPTGAPEDPIIQTEESTWTRECLDLLKFIVSDPTN